jgi:hypothetical protein
VRQRHEIAIGAGLGLAFLILYLTTLCPTVFWYDSAEYATAAAVLGIPHPPGYPLYTLIGHVFTWLPLEPAVAVNLMSAVFAALAVGLSYGLLRELGAGRLGAAVGAATLGATRLFWSNAVIAEVYTPNAAALIAVTWLVVRGRNQRRDRLIIGGAVLAGLSLGLHLSIATCGIGLAVLVAGARCDTLAEVASKHMLAARAKLAAWCAAAAFAGSLIFLYLPLRARMDPPLNFGDPSTWKQLKWHITGGNYKNWFGVDTAERAADLAQLFYDQLLLAGLALAAIGAVSIGRRSGVVAVALLAMVLGNVTYFFDYRVHDFEVFFIPTLVVLCWLVGLGADEIVSQLRARRPALAPVLAAILALLPAGLIPANYSAVDLSDFDAAERYAETLVETLPEGAVIINFTTPPEWKVDAVFGFYYQLVLRKRLDVRVTKQAPHPRVIVDLLRDGTPVYLYHPVDSALRLFEVVPEGPLFRIVAPRRR